MHESVNSDIDACASKTRRLIFKNTALSYQKYNLFNFLRLKRYLYIIKEKITMESFLTHNIRFGQVRSHSNLDLILT